MTLTTRSGCAGSARLWEKGCTLGSKKLSISYVTGRDELDPTQVDGAQSFTRYARAMLGCEVPVGGKFRGIWYQQLSEEMEVQGWTWDDLTFTVQYLNRRGIVILRVAGILHFVQEALKERKVVEDTDLHLKVAEAMSKETDEGWLRRLSLARGKALGLVYNQWREAHEV